MGLFDNIGQNKQTGQPSFVQEAIAFGKVDLNTIFKYATVAAITWISNAVKFFHDMFGSSCNHDDNVLMERMVNQIPGMVLVAIKLGWVDSSFMQAYTDDPTRANYTSSRLNATQCSAMINPARLLFTVLFGVRIINNVYLDALQAGVNAYYQVDNGEKTADIPREAVARAVRLKQTYFPDWMYDTKQWDLNIFQENPLVAPIPDLQVGKLFTGNIFGVDVVNGLVQGSPIPILPGNTGSSGTTTTVPTTQAQNLMDKIISFVKTNPKGAIGLGAVAALAINELSDD